MLIANLFAASLAAAYFQLSINNVDDIYHKKMYERKSNNNNNKNKNNKQQSISGNKSFL